MSEPKKLDLIGHIRPLHLLTTLVLYFLGIGFARFLGERIDQGTLLLGLGWLMTLSTGLHFLGDYFDTPFDQGLPERQIQKSDQKKDVLIFIAAALLATTAFLTIFWIASAGISAPLAVVLGFHFFIYGSLVVPGLGIDQTGIGEFFTSFVLVVIPPAVGYLSQVGEYHRFLTLAIFPLFPLHLGLVLTLRLKTFADDLRIDRKTLLVRLGWKRGIVVHNLMLLGGFLLFGFAMVFGMSLRMIGPVFFALPAAGYLIWMLTNFERGAPVRWNLIRFLSLVVFFLPVYMILYTAWFQ